MSYLWAALAIMASALLGFWTGRKVRPQAPVVSKPLTSELELEIAKERERVYSDLHDDLGAKLLHIVYSAPDAALSDVARSCLRDLREVVSRARGETGTLRDMLDQIEVEARTRLEAAGIALDWQDSINETLSNQEASERAGAEVPTTAAQILLNHAQSLQLFRITREAISNTIKHARAKTLKVRVALIAGELLLDLSDDGVGGELEQVGRGMSNMRKRAEDIAGKITWREASIGGVRVLLRVPLKS
jgi:signal transduction histidine kinase